MFVAMVVLPTPPLGEKTPITVPLPRFRLAGLVWRPVAAGEGLAGTFQKDPDLRRIGRGAEDVPDAGAHGLQDEVGIRLADQENAQVREPGRQAPWRGAEPRRRERRDPG